MIWSKKLSSRPSGQSVSWLKDLKQKPFPLNSNLQCCFQAISQNLSYCRTVYYFSSLSYSENKTYTWWSGYCDLNKGECDLNQSKDGSFVKRVAKNNSWNNGDRHKNHEIFLTNCFVFVVTLVWQTVQSSATTQITANLMEKTLQLTVPE